jgi:hypothetical protein
MLERLRDVDLELGQRRSLHPERAQASSLTGLGELLLAAEDPPALKAAFARGLSAVALAIARNFPENIFWDLDFLAASLVASARAVYAEGDERRALAGVERATELLVEVQAQYGVESPIRFRYVHDFLYGYDWARWVAREPEQRRHIGPYDLVFLRRMHQRAGELAELIEADDATYPRLIAGERRNPFGFSREPDAEMALLLELSGADLVPVEAWRIDPVPEWNRPYGELREQRARRLGLMHRAR